MSSKKTTNALNVLLPDGENPLLVQVVYCLSQNRDIKIHVMSSKKGVPMKYSRFVDAFTFQPWNTPKDWIEKVNTYVAEHDIDLVLPICEETHLCFIENKTLFNKPDTLVYLSDREDYIKGIDKGQLAIHMEKMDIPHPPSMVYRPGQGIFKMAETLNYPIIAKPTRGLDGSGIRFFEAKEELIAFFRDNKTSRDYVLQEYIDGYDVDCSVLCKNGELIAWTMQKGILFENRNFSPAIGLQFVENEELLNTVKQLMKTLNWNGVAHLDLRYDKNANDFKVIEINGRFWGSLDASMFAGVNFPYLYCKSSIGDEVAQQNIELVKYLNLKGLVKSVFQNPLNLFRFKFILNNTPLKLSFIDPLPVILRFISRTKNILLRDYISKTLVFKGVVENGLSNAF